MLALTAMQLATLAVAVASIVFAQPLARAWRRVAQRAPRLERGKLVLRHSNSFLGILLTGAALLLSGGAYSLYLAWQLRSGAPVWQLVVLVVVALGAIVVGVEFAAMTRVRLELDAEGLRGRTKWTGYRQMLWGEVAVVRYSTWTKQLTMRDRAGRAVVAGAIMPGFHLLLEQLSTRLPAAIWSPAVPLAAEDPLA